MLLIKPQHNLKNAKEYFRKHLNVGDYYTQEGQVRGYWLGQGCEKLQLAGLIQQGDFHKLCDNLDPRTGERLTLRHKTTRIERDDQGKKKKVSNRRIFYDSTFSPPKSVSLLALIGGDTRVIEAHDEAVKIALRELESYAYTRVRKNGAMGERPTGNMVAAVFRHNTSRALDPHLHSHCLLFNATYDPVEECWKALEKHQIYKVKKFVENVYYHELARILIRYGYTIENLRRGDFNVREVPQELSERFSKRRKEIDRKTRELLEKAPEKANRNVYDIREKIAHKHRPRKDLSVSAEALAHLWASQVTPSEKAILAPLNLGVKAEPAGNAQAAVDWAEEHLFARHSVVSEHELWLRALEHARGHNLTAAEVKAETKKRDYVRDVKYSFRLATRPIWEREQEIIRLAKNGVGKFTDPMVMNPWSSSGRLNGQQRVAVENLLKSRDFVTIFRGGAGTGKSYTLGEVRNRLLASGHEIHVMAPQRQQVMNLERDGMTGAQTVSEFLVKQHLPCGAVVIVDEAGQMGAQQMQQLLQFTNRRYARVILSGDTRQHGAVAASDALVILEKHAELKAVELNEIRRQDPSLGKTKAERTRIEEYRQAVQEASEGNLRQSFDRLDKLGAVVVCSPEDQQSCLAEHYLSLTRKGNSVAVVSQTWEEVKAVNEAVRAVLKFNNLLGVGEKTVVSLEPVNLTDAQKRDKQSYTDGTVVVFNRPVGKFEQGETARLMVIGEKELIVENEHKVGRVPFRFLDRITICQSKKLAVASGDCLQLKANGKSTQGKRLANGERVTVEKVMVDGRIKLEDGRIVGNDYRQFVRGFAITSYGSQGMTVDNILFSDSAIKAATNARQWYVTISRGRKGILIFTSDKAQLRENITRSGDRELAIELTEEPPQQRISVVQDQPGPKLSQNESLTEEITIKPQQKKLRVLKKIQSIHRWHSRGMGV